MEVGKLYEFYGSVDFNDHMIGEYAGIDEDTKFLKFKYIAKKTTKEDLIRDIAIEENAGSSINCMGGGRDKKAAQMFLNEYECGKLIPHFSVRHMENSYNVNALNSIKPVMDYMGTQEDPK